MGYSNPGRFDVSPPLSYDQVCGPDTIAQLTPASGKTLAVGEVIITNRSGGAADIGVAYIQKDAMWKAGQWDDSETPAYTDDTTDAQDAGASDFPLFTTTNNDGFVVQSIKQFNVIGIAIGATAEAGTPTYVYEYWDGSAWAALDQSNAVYKLPDYTDDNSNQYLAFPAPHDWTALAAGDAPVDDEGLDAGKYAIRASASTAPSTAPIANKLWVCTLIDIMPQVADDAALNFELPTETILPANSSIVPYFGTANAGNTVQVHHKELS